MSIVVEFTPGHAHTQRAHLVKVKLGVKFLMYSQLLRIIYLLQIIPVTVEEEQQLFKKYICIQGYEERVPPERVMRKGCKPKRQNNINVRTIEMIRISFCRQIIWTFNYSLRHIPKSIHLYTFSLHQLDHTKLTIVSRIEPNQ